ncbi:pectin lyase fold/virulence factor [Mycena albidolilacea]|uniref:pectin lyase n=1 Tax=Mycena albidolilacea TaxID=1033008 RepID=A0AAD7A4B4_9AGAR|nr:pectin lyase fold/virulence factor [Mycena albidolilacea]
MLSADGTSNLGNEVKPKPKQCLVDDESDATTLTTPQRHPHLVTGLPPSAPTTPQIQRTAQELFSSPSPASPSPASPPLFARVAGSHEHADSVDSGADGRQALYAQLAMTPVGALNDMRHAFMIAAKGAGRGLASLQPVLTLAVLNDKNSIFSMKPSQLTVAFFAGFVHVASAAISSVVTGVPVDFGTPTTIAELKTYLTSSSPQVVISGTFNFAGSEGTQSLTACNAYHCTPSDGGQALRNALNGCTEATYAVTIDTAAYQGIEVASDETLVGTNGAILNGKGLRLVNVNNVIIQNIKIENLDPQYVWGDAISLSGTSNVWIDHVTTLTLGRQHYSFGPIANIAPPATATRRAWSWWAAATSRNWVYSTSGPSPALSDTTLFHAVNNGNYFLDTPTIVASGSVVALYSSEAADLARYQASLGRSCVANLLGTGAASSVNYDTTSFLTKFAGHNTPPASNADSVAISLLLVINKADNTP